MVGSAAGRHRVRDAQGSPGSGGTAGAAMRPADPGAKSAPVQQHGTAQQDIDRERTACASSSNLMIVSQDRLRGQDRLLEQDRDQLRGRSN